MGRRRAAGGGFDCKDLGDSMRIYFVDAETKHQDSKTGEENQGMKVK